MEIGLGIYIIIAVIIIGWLYWDKMQEVKRLKAQWNEDEQELIMGGVIWAEKDLEAMKKELDQIAQSLDEKGVKLDCRTKYSWGWEYKFRNDEDIAEIYPYYSIYYCNPAQGIRKIRASCVMLDKDLHCEQVLDILAENEEFIGSIHCYDGELK